MSPAVIQRAGSPWSWIVGVALAVAVVFLAWITACVVGDPVFPWDDNYISYIYSRNLAQGNGLRYNATDPAPTEGFSSLSHVLLVALTDRFRIDPHAATGGLSLVFFVLIPVLVGLPLATLLEMSAISALSICYAGQILYFLSLGSVFNLAIGMETIISMGGVAALAGWSITEFSPGGATPRSTLWRTVSGCLATTLVVLGRPEGPVIVVLTLGTVLLGKRLIFPESHSRANGSLLPVAAFAALGIITYFLWKFAYFGYFLPNPYYVKSHNAIMGKKNLGLPGWPFTKEFLGLIWPWLAAGLPLLLFARGSRVARTALLVAVIPGVVMVLAYTKAIHEAAVWYRYEFPYLVYLHLLLSGLACLVARRLPALPMVCVAAAILWVTSHDTNSAILRRNPLAFLDVRVGPRNTLERMGVDLSKTGLGQRATIAVSAAGAIPYLSGFRAIDMVGLNDNFLSGRSTRTIAEVWSYIDSLKPDVIQSGFPPASPGVSLDQYDPVLSAPALAPLSRGEFGDELSKFSDRGKLMESMRREMILLRDRYTFGAAYRWGDGWLMLYVRRDSPHWTRIQQALGISPAIERLSDLRPHFINDPRKLSYSDR